MRQKLIPLIVLLLLAVPIMGMPSSHNTVDVPMISVEPTQSVPLANTQDIMLPQDDVALVDLFWWLRKSKRSVEYATDDVALVDLFWWLRKSREQPAMRC